MVNAREGKITARQVKAAVKTLPLANNTCSEKNAMRKIRSERKRLIAEGVTGLLRLIFEKEATPEVLLERTPGLGPAC